MVDGVGRVGKKIGEPPEFNGGGCWSKQEFKGKSRCGFEEDGSLNVLVLSFMLNKSLIL